MKRGFYTIMTAQFFSSLADNALFVVAVELLRSGGAPEWQSAALVPMFALFYVVLAPFVGAFADALPKGQVMFISNAIKVVGCLLMLTPVHPLLAYAIVGLGAAAYSPAKYGILTELLPPSQLVKANGWIEGLTIASIILGVVLGGQLVGPLMSGHLLAIDVPGVHLDIHTPAQAAVVLLVFVYGVAAWFNTRIPAHRRGAAPHAPQHPGAVARLLDLQQPPLARPAGADFTGHHHPVLGREWQPALHRAGLGGGSPGLHHHAGLDPGGRGGRGHGRGRGGGFGAHAAGTRHARHAAGHCHGAAGGVAQLHRQRLGGRAVSGLAGRPGRIPGGADERPASAPGPQPDGRRAPLHCGAFNEQACILVLGALYTFPRVLGLSAFAAITAFGLLVAGVMWVIQRWHRHNERIAGARRDDLHG
jgi:MFS transporter, LPLT family, lysophospholipid transporter